MDSRQHSFSHSQDDPNQSPASSPRCIGSTLPKTLEATRCPSDKQSSGQPSFHTERKRTSKLDKIQQGNAQIIEKFKQSVKVKFNVKKVEIAEKDRAAKLTRK